MYSLNGRIILIILVVGLISVGCRGPEASEIPVSTQRVPVATPAIPKNNIRIEFPELILFIEDANLEDFEVTLRQRTATIKPKTLEGIDGRKVKIEESELTGLTARIRFDIGFLQYLTDDVRASPLDVSHESDWTAVNVLSNEIQIPQFYKNREDVIEVYKQLGFQSNENFLISLESKYFERVKPVSYRAQRNYFASVLETDRARYQECCPEYLKQAEKFLSRSVSEFKTFEALGVEIFLKEWTLEIAGVDKAGQPVKFTIVGIG